MLAHNQNLCRRKGKPNFTWDCFLSQLHVRLYIFAYLCARIGAAAFRSTSVLLSQRCRQIMAGKGLNGSACSRAWRTAASDCDRVRKCCLGLILCFNSFHTCTVKGLLIRHKKESRIILQIFLVAQLLYNQGKTVHLCVRVIQSNMMICSVRI